jgi:hypothetical protein
MPALRAFFAISSQWRTVVIDNRVVPTALDYKAAKAGLKLAGIKVKPHVWLDVQVIEQAALKAMREKRA